MLCFQGFQRLTLLDFPGGKTACTLFTSGCNFRCPFCHNASLVTHYDPYCATPQGEIFAFLEKRKKVLDGLCLSGGEPLMQNGVEEFLTKVKEIGYLVKLDTNGTFPDKLKNLVEKGLVDYVAMDIKNSKQKYLQTVGLSEFDMSTVFESVDYLMSGVVDYEFRTTVAKPFHAVEDFQDIGVWLNGCKKYCLQTFVDSGDLIGNGMQALSREDMQKAYSIMKNYAQEVILR